MKIIADNSPGICLSLLAPGSVFRSSTGTLFLRGAANKDWIHCMALETGEAVEFVPTATVQAVEGAFVEGYTAVCRKSGTKSE